MVDTRLLTSSKPPTSCVTCFAWGRLPGRICRACYSFGQNHEPGECASCHRVVPLKKSYCRLCWCQAGLEASFCTATRCPVIVGNNLVFRDDNHLSIS